MSLGGFSLWLIFLTEKKKKFLPDFSTLPMQLAVTAPCEGKVSILLVAACMFQKGSKTKFFS